MLLPVCQCAHSVISANRPEEPSPAGPREEAEDFRATDSGVMIKLHLTDLARANQQGCTVQHVVESRC